MVELQVYDAEGKATSKVKFDESVFGDKVKSKTLREVVYAYEANLRQGNANSKNLSDVAGSNKKPWKQKGTGNARAGMASSPLWRGGGKIFPNTPDENFSQKVNRKMYRAGMAAILSQLAREDRLAVVDGFSIEAPKTRLLSQKLKGMGLESVLVITEEIDENLFLSSRNLHHVLVLSVSEADPVSLVRFPKVLVTKGALAKMEEAWQ